MESGDNSAEPVVVNSKVIVLFVCFVFCGKGDGFRIARAWGMVEKTRWWFQGQALFSWVVISGLLAG